MPASRKAFGAGAIGVLAMCGSTVQLARGADPWADGVVSFDAGSNPAPSYNDPGAVLGSPERFTGELTPFPSVVSPLSPPFGTDELVSIGAGGHLTVRFDEPIVDDGANPFGIDLLIFGNAGFIAGPDGLGDPPAMFGVGGAATVQVSQNGADWVTLGTRPLDLFPTLGYLDSGPFDAAPGSIESDFTRPVDPSISLGDLGGLSYTELVWLYDGSGGGIGFDLAGSGLGEISYVRVLNESDTAFEIDAFADVAVPSPGGVAWVAPLGVFASRRRRR